MRDDLQLIRDKTTELEIKVDRDINELKSSVEKGKNDTVGLRLQFWRTFPVTEWQTPLPHSALTACIQDFCSTISVAA